MSSIQINLIRGISASTKQKKKIKQKMSGGKPLADLTHTDPRPIKICVWIRPSVCAYLSQTDRPHSYTPEAHPPAPHKVTHLLFDVAVATGGQPSESQSHDEAPHWESRLSCWQHSTRDPQSQGCVLRGRKRWKQWRGKRSNMLHNIRFDYFFCVCVCDAF